MSEKNTGSGSADSHSDKGATSSGDAGSGSGDNEPSVIAPAPTSDSSDGGAKNEESDAQSKSELPAAAAKLSDDVGPFSDGAVDTSVQAPLPRVRREQPSEAKKNIKDEIAKLEHAAAVADEKAHAQLKDRAIAGQTVA